jgi:hypothetical protein
MFTLSMPRTNWSFETSSMIARWNRNGMPDCDSVCAHQDFLHNQPKNLLAGYDIQCVGSFRTFIAAGKVLFERNRTPVKLRKREIGCLLQAFARVLELRRLSQSPHRGRRLS